MNGAKQRLAATRSLLGRLQPLAALGMGIFLLVPGSAARAEGVKDMARRLEAPPATVESQPTEATPADPLAPEPSREPKPMPSQDATGADPAPDIQPLPLAPSAPEATKAPLPAAAEPIPAKPPEPELLPQHPTTQKPAGSAIAPRLAPVSASKIERVIHEVKACQFIDPDYRESVSVELSGDLAAIGVYRNPAANWQDCKIDAVLIAGKLLAVVPAGLQIVKVRFYDFNKQDTYWEVKVPVAEVQKYARRAITQKDLLNSIHLATRRDNPLGAKYAGWSYKEIVEDETLVAGPLASQRKDLAARVAVLRANGADVMSCQETLLRGEDMVRRGQETELKAWLECAASQVAALEAGNPNGKALGAQGQAP